MLFIIISEQKYNSTTEPKHTLNGSFAVVITDSEAAQLGDWRTDKVSGWCDLPQQSSNNYCSDAREVREKFCKCLNTVEQVLWIVNKVTQYKCKCGLCFGSLWICLLGKRV